MAYTPRWPRHKLSQQEGLRMLWHIFEYLEVHGETEAGAVVRSIINRMLKGLS